MDVIWERIGMAEGGTVTALALSPDFAHDGTAFAATMAGLSRSQDGGRSWCRVGAGFTGTSLTALAVSPAFAQDGLIFAASLEGRLFRVTRGGTTWTSADFGGRHVHIAAVAPSPELAHDGTVFAATMGGGVFRSNDRGANWAPYTFGLLDLDVLALAVSPAFARDEMLFAATNTGIFRSTNGGRAWRDVAFPAEAVQCLAISPDFREDGTLFAGTDAAGLFYSTDRGATWHHVDGALDRACINGIALSPGFRRDRTVLVATESAVYVSRDAGEGWACCAEMSGALCLAVAPTFPAGGPALVGCSHRGVYRSTGNLVHWQAANDGLAGRRLTGLVLSPTFAADRRMVTFGVGEEVLGSHDGGVTWVEADDGLPSLHVAALAVATTRDAEPHLYAALPQGIWMSRRWGVSWEQVSDLSARLLVLSPAFARDPVVLVATEGGGLRVSWDAAGRWQPVDMPCDGEILALTVAPTFAENRRVCIAVHQHDEARAAIWQGTIGGSWECLISHPGTAQRAIVATSPTLAWGGVWYATIDEQLYELCANAVRGRAGEHRPAGAGCALTPEQPAVIDLAVLHTAHATGVLAATERGLYLLAHSEKGWRLLDDDTVPRAIVAVAPSPEYIQDSLIYALELGGNLWRLRVLPDYFSQPHTKGEVPARDAPGLPGPGHNGRPCDGPAHPRPAGAADAHGGAPGPGGAATAADQTG